jgi:hypothetical protein
MFIYSKAKHLKPPQIVFIAALIRSGVMGSWDSLAPFGNTPNKNFE